MSVLTIAIVGAAIATGFYYMNRDTAASKKRLRESTAMVFILSTAVLLVAKFFGLGQEADSPGPASAKARFREGSSVKAVPLDYIIGGEPPF